VLGDELVWVGMPGDVIVEPIPAHHRERAIRERGDQLCPQP
jgi:hypothetical protein